MHQCYKKKTKTYPGSVVFPTVIAQLRSLERFKITLRLAVGFTHVGDAIEADKMGCRLGDVYYNTPS